MKKKNTFTYLLIGLGLCFSSLGSELRADTPRKLYQQPLSVGAQTFYGTAIGQYQS